MKRITIFLILAVSLAGILSSCQRKYVTEEKTRTIHYKDGSTMTKSYSQTAPDLSQTDTKKAPKPKLKACKAKRLVKAQLKENDQIVLTEPIAIGYYECNCAKERSKLYMLAANNIIKFSCDEIMHNGVPSYWVNVELTWKGRLLRVDSDKKQYPEDKIDWMAVENVLTPHLDQDDWGVPTYDSHVDSVVVKGMHAFYEALAAGQSIENSLLSADMLCAVKLLNVLREYDVEKIVPNPFYRTLSLTREMVADMQIMRLPRLADGYMVSLGGEDFLYAMQVVDNKLEIMDVVCATPNADEVLDPTVCSIAGAITEQEILQARESKLKNDEMREKMLQKQEEKKEQAINKEEEEQEHFEMCTIGNTGIARIEHSDPTMYELAKQVEHKQVVKLRTGKWRLKKVRDIKVEECGDTYKATCVLVKCMSRVSAVGRIYQNLEQGKIEKMSITFTYDEDEGWQLENICADDVPAQSSEASASCVEMYNGCALSNDEVIGLLVTETEEENIAY